MEQHPDNRPATKGELRDSQNLTETRIVGLETRQAEFRDDTRARFADVNSRFAELRGDFRSFSSSKFGFAALITAAVVGAIFTAALAVLIDRFFS